MEKELKVSKTTEPKKLAGTIRHYLNKGYECNLFAVGQHSIYIGVKSIALLSPMFEINYQCNISYFHQQVDKIDLSGICFHIINN